MSDGIDKEIVLHCLKSASDFHDEICEECPVYAKCDHTWKSKVYERAIELIENQWIPVEERLPENEKYIGRYYLVTLEYRNLNMNSVTCARFESSDRWIRDCAIGEVDTTDEVIAWMPLPEAYESREEMGSGQRCRD